MIVDWSLDNRIIYPSTPTATTTRAEGYILCLPLDEPVGRLHNKSRHLTGEHRDQRSSQWPPRPTKLGKKSSQVPRLDTDQSRIHANPTQPSVANSVCRRRSTTSSPIDEVSMHAMLSDQCTPLTPEL